MNTFHHSSCCSDSSEIIVPVTLELFIYFQPQEEKKQPIGYSPRLKPRLVSSVTIDDRAFIYEVVGLRENVRRSGRFYLTVPYRRMNQEMQRITRQGGQILSVRPKI